ncbi:adenosine deaminase family protein [Microbulbifer harenosus]|uniref:Adenosine deaminase n=1 Tax=Microbulbifer harenosus TaxID=2576840 RepID=A0ABY2UD65_9GAMM|nr:MULTISPECIES: adenosine deaminase [Microbulbifer]QIL90562.1 adenosine deaminase [Microbulbifer sp. SH-1]TLM74334.1 adenosine deaminase [Microbulbifer harenosus]
MAKRFKPAIFRTLGICASLLAGIVSPSAGAAEQWFEAFKASADDRDLYRFLYALPKGGDLHNHLTGSNFSEWWYQLATNKKLNGGYEYYTRVRIDNCAGYGHDMFGMAPYLMYFRNLQASSYQALSDCEKGEYKKIDALDPGEKTAWMNSLRLDKKHEGREEFFQTHWQRLNDLGRNPYINAEMLVKNMQAFAREGLSYLETMEGTRFYTRPDGSAFTPDEVADIFRKRLAQSDAVATGVTARMQYYLLRFIGNAEEDLEWIYRFVNKNRDLFVGINMVGREDNDKGYPLRFLPTLRKLRRDIPGIPLAIHAGEVDEPNHHVRDTLLLGASRIGHGVNLISDPDTMLLMRNSDYLVEINLISNLLLDYVDDYSQHPFPEYLRMGIPVALSTDDRGMWDSNMTDEYFVAVKEFNLSWEELTSLARNSLQHSFADDETKRALLQDYETRLEQFKKRFQRHGSAALDDVVPRSHGFICKHYKLCEFSTPVMAAN